MARAELIDPQQSRAQSPGGKSHDSGELFPFIASSIASVLSLVSLDSLPLRIHHPYSYRPYRKPLVVIAPKTLLRLAEAQSPLTAMGPGTSFAPVLDDPEIPSSDQEIQRLVLCSGKIYYELHKQRQQREANDTALV